MNENARERTTLSQVAVLAGVSTSTVSLVLAGKADLRRIPEETQQRVRQAAERLNYAPNLLTRSLRRGRTQVLSFFSGFGHRERGDQYMDRASSAIELAGGELGYDILVHCNFKRTPREVYEFLNGGLADGLILFAPREDDPLLPYIRKSPLPVVIINGRDPLGHFSSVVEDVEQGMQLVVNALVEAGHRRIVALGGRGGDVRDSDRRLQLLEANLAAKGVDFRAAEAELDLGDCHEVLARWMALPEPPTAVFCWHDRLAYRFLEACEDLGVQVPSQLALVGYDGIRWSSATRHQAATVVVDFDAVALKAISRLALEIAAPSSSIVEEVVPVSFDYGTTLGPCTSLQRSKP